MIKEFNSLEEIQKYYDKETGTYEFKESWKYYDLVRFTFDLNIAANIHAFNIDGKNIKVKNIYAANIDALDIDALYINANYINASNMNVGKIYATDIIARNIIANYIDYYGVCLAYKNIKCKSIRRRRTNGKHFVLDGKLEIEREE